MKDRVLEKLKEGKDWFAERPKVAVGVACVIVVMFVLIVL